MDEDDGTASVKAGTVGLFALLIDSVLKTLFMNGFDVDWPNVSIMSIRCKKKNNISLDNNRLYNELAALTIVGICIVIGGWTVRWWRVIAKHCFKWILCLLLWISWNR